MMWEADADASAVRLDSHRNQLESILDQSHRSFPKLPMPGAILLNVDNTDSKYSAPTMNNGLPVISLKLKPSRPVATLHPTDTSAGAAK